MGRSAQVDDTVGAGDATAAVVADASRPRQRISELLVSGRIRVVAQVRTSEHVVDGSGIAPPAVVVLCCPENEADTAVRALKRDSPGSRIVLVVPANGTARMLRAALRARVDALVYEDQLGQALLPSVHAVLAEQVVFPRRGRRRLEPPPLSHRERQVLRLVVQGCTNDEIGRRLFVAPSTVKSHLTSAFSKLAVRSRSEVTALVLDPDEPAARAILAVSGDGQDAAPWR